MRKSCSGFINSREIISFFVSFKVVCLEFLETFLSRRQIISESPGLQTCF